MASTPKEKTIGYSRLRGTFESWDLEMVVSSLAGSGWGSRRKQEGYRSSCPETTPRSAHMLQWPNIRLHFDISNNLKKIFYYTFILLKSCLYLTASTCCVMVGSVHSLLVRMDILIYNYQLLRTSHGTSLLLLASTQTNRSLFRHPLASLPA